jgi:ATP-dependent RNA helicase DeaD
MVDDLTEHLNTQGYSADRLHGDMNQAQRDRVMQKFRKSGLEFLVATDVAARGIDVDDVQVVFNYDLPYDVEDYLHRIGRTGRAGRSGRAISFVAGREVFQIQNIERFTKVRIQRGKPPTVGEVEEARAGVFLDKLRALLASGDFRRHDHIVERLMEEGFSSPDIASALIHHLLGGDATGPRPAERPAPKPAEVVKVARVEREREPARQPERSQDRPPRERPQHDKRPNKFERREDKRPPWLRKDREKDRPAVAAAPRVHTESPDKPMDSSKKAKKSRRTPVEQTRLWMNVGEEMGIQPIDVVNAVTGETGLPGKVVGTIDVRDRHLFADVSAEHAASIVAKLNRSDLKGHKLKVKLA